MAEPMEESHANSSDGSEDELIRELLDDESPFFLLPKSIESQPSISMGPVRSRLLSTIYSGPTIDDIKNALSTPNRPTGTDDHKTSRSTVLTSEKGLSKMENKYTLKIKSSGDGMADDGYKWRKYGQKSIKNSPNPRCTNPRCSAKKQVERSTEDPDALMVTYEGLHLHFTYSHFLSTKRTKTDTSPKGPQPQLGPTLLGPETIQPQKAPPREEAGPTNRAPQGLLEDVVPLIIRNPFNNPTLSGDPCLFSHPPSPRSSSSSSISWSPKSTSFEV
ncbi:probable WRKY transcription factor 49 isoform X2 [Magnolia sinica]|uniref:probable WRKY transcription factor 49 isoform X2 n=1 Tax=Magnolia sinica TaxID=86752 RepID=UPI00265AD4DF|nr:probable WRKY transcription factor 49 isoform X2 [Magnolia sinica]